MSLLITLATDNHDLTSDRISALKNIGENLLCTGVFHKVHSRIAERNRYGYGFTVIAIPCAGEESVGNSAAQSCLAGDLIKIAHLKALGSEVRKDLKGLCRIKLAALVLDLIYKLRILVCVKGKVYLNTHGIFCISESGRMATVQKPTLVLCWTIS